MAKVGGDTDDGWKRRAGRTACWISSPRSQVVAHVAGCCDHAPLLHGRCGARPLRHLSRSSSGQRERRGHCSEAAADRALSSRSGHRCAGAVSRLGPGHRSRPEGRAVHSVHQARRQHRAIELRRRRSRCTARLPAWVSSLGARGARHANRVRCALSTITASMHGTLVVTTETAVSSGRDLEGVCGAARPDARWSSSRSAFCSTWRSAGRYGRQGISWRGSTGCRAATCPAACRASG